MASIAENLQAVRQQMAAACQRVQRDPATVRLVAVSKTRPASQVMAAMAAGQLLFGENRVQETREKMARLSATPAHFHLIGPLQRNKVQEAVALFDMIESVDSLEVAREIHRRASRPMAILVQVNVGREPQKHGFAPEELAEALGVLAGLSQIRVEGLMTVPPLLDDPEAVRPCFRQLAELARHMDGLAIPGIGMGELSMGMSHDFTTAIEEGATLVRVGSAIFGPRY